MDGNGDRINEIADRVARIEGKLDVFFMDQGRRCAAHDQNLRDANQRLSLVEAGIESARREGMSLVAISKDTAERRFTEIEETIADIKADSVTRGFLFKTVTLAISAVGVLSPIIYAVVKTMIQGAQR